MHNSVDTVRNAFEHRSAGTLPRGELWLGTELLKKAHLKNTLEGHLSLIERLGQDIMCLPLSNERTMNEALGYRYFDLHELAEVSGIKNLFVIVIIDGPFQRLVDNRGLMNVLTGWRREREEFKKAYEQERAAVDVLIKRSLELPIGAIVIADDVAGERAPFVNPDDLQELCAPFYIKTISEIHSGHAYALLHSCGNITRLIPHLISYEFDGLAAIQHRTNDLIALKKRYGSTLTFMAGIEAEVLEAEELSSSDRKEYKKIVRALAPDGGFIICSGSGLYAGRFLERVQELYRIADTIY
jgi:hypothetical protein